MELFHSSQTKHIQQNLLKLCAFLSWTDLWHSGELELAFTTSGPTTF